MAKACAHARTLAPQFCLDTTTSVRLAPPGPGELNTTPQHVMVSATKHGS